AINRLAYISKLADHRINIVHLSSALGYQEVLKAKEANVDILVETCPHYLILNDDKYELEFEEACKFVCSPPLRKPKDNVVLIQAILDNNINTIGSDHCSFDMASKRLGIDNFSKIPNGMPGVGATLKMIYTSLVTQDIISIEKMVALLATNVAKTYKIYPQKGSLKVGSDADIVIFNPHIKRIVTKEQVHTKAGYSPYEGMEEAGFIEYILLNGEVVVVKEQLIKRNKGLFIK
ncbi:MAG: amidohydrolase family protein, partial [Bacilli bacterium]